MGHYNIVIETAVVFMRERERVGRSFTSVIETALVLYERERERGGTHYVSVILRNR